VYVYLQACVVSCRWQWQRWSGIIRFTCNAAVSATNSYNCALRSTSSQRG